MKKIAKIALIVFILILLVIVGIAISILMDEKAKESVGFLMIPACSVIALMSLVGIGLSIYLLKKK